MQTLSTYYHTKPDRRRTVRREVSLAAHFQFKGHVGWIACEIVNISPMGALLKPALPTIASGEIRLQIAQDFFEATAEIRHQDGKTIGIEFTSSRIEALARYS